jgi:hypothetical protein
VVSWVRHQGIRKVRGDGGCYDLQVVAIFRLEVASIDKRIAACEKAASAPPEFSRCAIVSRDLNKALFFLASCG